MTRPHVLCVSGDSATRAAVTLSLSKTAVRAAVTEGYREAIERLKASDIDAVVIDVTTVTNVASLVEAVDTLEPNIPTFAHWGDSHDSSLTALCEVIATAEDDRDEKLATAITDRIDTVSPSSPLGKLTQQIKCELADSSSPGDIDRAFREGLTADDRFPFVWLGEYDPGERKIVPWLTTPGTVSWPLQQTFNIGDGSQPLLEQVLRTKDHQLVQDIESNQSVVPLGSAAIDHGANAMMVAPLESHGELYGIAVVYARTSFSATDRDAIMSVAETASSALESIVLRGQLDQQEQVLRRYERLVETAGDGMYIIDEDGHLTTVNDALLEMTGYSLEGVLGEHLSLFIDDDDVTAGTERINALLESEENTDTLEVTVETKDGTTIPCETQLSVLVHDGEFSGSVGVVRDITERKEREQRLRDQNERLDAFAGIVSHDLRNPLGVSQGYLDLLEESGSLEHIEPIRHGLNRMEDIIEDVLMIAREGETVTETELVDLETVVESSWETVSTREATLVVEQTMPINVDQSRFRRLLENLFRNAVEHGGPTVTVRVGPLPDREGFYVADDGDGIPEKIRDRAFDSNVTTSGSGLGIGLWVVKEVADGHGWTTVAAESEDGGARFEFETSS